MDATELLSKLESVTLYDNLKESLLHNFKNERYIVVNESCSAHCCFDYTVVDTSFGNNGKYWTGKYNICECFNQFDAIKICYSLNQLNK